MDHFNSMIMDYGSFNHMDYHIGSCLIIPDHTGSYWIILNSGSWHIRSYQIMSYCHHLQMFAIFVDFGIQPAFESGILTPSSTVLILNGRLH